MDRETAIKIAAIFYYIYAFMLFIAMLGGGMNLSLVPPLYVSPIFLPNGSLFVLFVAFVALMLVVPKGTIAWSFIALDAIGGVLALFLGKDTLTIAGGIVMLVGAIIASMAQLGWLKEAD